MNNCSTIILNYKKCKKNIFNDQLFAGPFDTTKGIQCSQHRHETSTEEAAQWYSLPFNQNSNLMVLHADIVLVNTDIPNYNMTCLPSST